jgi:Ca-activated chloride channel homolog
MKRTSLLSALFLSSIAACARSPSFSMSPSYVMDRDAPTTEQYTNHGVNPWTEANADHLSTFAIDVDTASYTILRRKLLAGEEVPAAAVRVEELLNYFRYGYAPPTDGSAFAMHAELAPSPFREGRHILRVGLKGREVAAAARKPAHLVFLVDVSGSMMSSDKLGLVQQSLRILVNNLGPKDTVALVTYAGSTRVVLEPTGMDRRAEIHAAIESLVAGGGTGMSSGMDLAYGLAAQKVSPDSVSRVIVLSDGDANIGPSSHDEILNRIADHVKRGVTLSTVGFGMGNYKDTTMEQLADKGNGNYAYVDSLSEARRIFQEQLGGTLEVIAQDVKIQVDFDPKSVARYRLVGYENRDIADERFRDDAADAGELGAGHTVTALYELELAPGATAPVGTVRLRAKKPGPADQVAAEIAYPLPAPGPQTFDAASEDLRFAVAVMAAGEVLRASPHAEGMTIARARDIARAAAADRPERLEFVELLGRVPSGAAVAR